jgi:hypothetical protein
VRCNGEMTTRQMRRACELDASSGPRQRRLLSSGGGWFGRLGLPEEAGGDRPLPLMVVWVGNIFEGEFCGEYVNCWMSWENVKSIMPRIGGITLLAEVGSTAHLARL